MRDEEDIAIDIVRSLLDDQRCLVTKAEMSRDAEMEVGVVNWSCAGKRGSELRSFSFGYGKVRLGAWADYVSSELLREPTFCDLVTLNL